MVRMGGFAEDDEDDGQEREGILGRAKGELSGVKVRALFLPLCPPLKIMQIAVPETTVLVKQEPIYQAKTKKEARGGLNKWLTSHLPTAHQSTFRLRITPHMRAKQGTRLSWASVLIEDVQEALNIYAPGEKAVRGGPFVDLVRDLLYIVSVYSQLSSRLHIASTIPVRTWPSTPSLSCKSSLATHHSSTTPTSSSSMSSTR